MSTLTVTVDAVDTTLDITDYEDRLIELGAIVETADAGVFRLSTWDEMWGDSGGPIRESSRIPELLNILGAAQAAP